MFIDEINCGIFRCGAHTSQGIILPIDPHASKNGVEKLTLVAGCGQPFVYKYQRPWACDWDLAHSDHFIQIPHTTTP